MAIGGLTRRRRGPMTAAQQAALKKAIEASARARRGTGKPEAPSKPRKAAAPERKKFDAKAVRARGDATRSGRISMNIGASGWNNRLNKRGNPVRSPTDRAAGVRRGVGSQDPIGETLKSRIELRKKAIAKDTKARRDRANALTSTPTQKPSITTSSNDGPQVRRPTPGGSKSAMGTADPATMGVSQILKERKTLIAKQKSEGLTPEENKRLVAIKAESALRHQNRKAGKGTGPTKVALAKSDAKPKINTPIGSPSKNEDLKAISMVDLLKRQQDPKTSDTEKKMIKEELTRRGTAGGWNRTTTGSGTDGKARQLPSDSKKPSDYHDGTTFGEMDPANRKKMADMRREMQGIANKWIQRDNVMQELNNAKTVGQLVDAAQSVEWYLHEHNASSKTQPIEQLNKLFSELKKYSDRYESNADAYLMSNSELTAAIGKATGRKKAMLERELKRRQSKATAAGVRQPTFNRRTRMSGRG